jgi:lipid-A-disaccharide synthase
MEHLSLMGFIDPMLNLPKLLYMRYKLYKKIIKEQPDLFIGVDAPEFNLGLEKKLKQANITTVHYVSPSVWAWRTGRVKLIKKAVNLMLTLFPFEVDFYKDHQVPAVCVGHHLADQIPPETNHKLIKHQLGFNEHDKILTIMPGSRDSELKHLTKIYLQTAKEIFFRFPFIKFLLPVVSAEHKQYVGQLVKNIARNLPIKIVVQDSNRAIQAANFVLVTSGTATLEILLHKKPMIVAYKTNYLTYMIIKKLIKVKYISLPNLLANAPLVEEFIQHQVTPYNLTRALSKLISISDLPTKQKNIFDQIHQSLQKNASVTAAQEIIKLLPCTI